MNLKKVSQLMLKYAEDTFSISNENVSIKEENNFLTLNFNLLSNVIDDSVTFKLELSDSGMMFLTLILDKLPINQHNLKLVNNYNSQTVFLKAFIDEESTYLYFTHVILNVKDEDSVITNAHFLLDNFLDESNLTYLKPLTELTK